MSINYFIDTFEFSQKYWIIEFIAVICCETILNDFNCH